MLTRNNNKEKDINFVFTFKKGKYKKQTFELNMMVCVDPLCGCREMALEFCPEGESNSTKIVIELDLETQELINQDSPNVDAEFGELFLKELTEDDWSDLDFWHNRHKSLICETADYSSLYTEFPMEDVEEGILIYYDEIIPYQMPIFLIVNNQLVFVADMYCLSPHCDCTSAHLLFVPSTPFEENIDEDEDYNPLRIDYDYKTGKWEVEERGELEFAPQMLMDQLLSTFNLKSIYSTRHRNLRTLYRNYRKHYFEQNVTVHSDKIGRNDLCPCGSGKKYKQCCMNKKE